MNRIYRYELEIVDRQVIPIPLGSVVLSVAPGRSDDFHLDLWALTTGLPDVDYTFQIFGTGHPMPDDITRLKFIGTCVMSGLVWHVFRELTGNQQ